MLLPGPEAQQLATYIGWLLHRMVGGIVAGGLFILPGIFAMVGLSYIYAAYGNIGFVEALFFGLKAAVLSRPIAGSPQADWITPIPASAIRQLIVPIAVRSQAWGSDQRSALRTA